MAKPGVSVRRQHPQTSLSPVLYSRGATIQVGVLADQLINSKGGNKILQDPFAPHPKWRFLLDSYSSDCNIFCMSTAQPTPLPFTGKQQTTCMYHVPQSLSTLAAITRCMCKQCKPGTYSPLPPPHLETRLLFRLDSETGLILPLESYTRIPL